MYILFRPAKNKVLRWLLGDYGHVELLLTKPNQSIIIGGSWTRLYMKIISEDHSILTLRDYTAVLDTRGLEPDILSWYLPSLFNCCTLIKKFFGLGLNPITPRGLFDVLREKGARVVGYNRRSSKGEKLWYINNLMT